MEDLVVNFHGVPHEQASCWSAQHAVECLANQLLLDPAFAASGSLFRISTIAFIGRSSSLIRLGCMICATYASPEAMKLPLAEKFSSML